MIVFIAAEGFIVLIDRFFLSKTLKQLLELRTWYSYCTFKSNPVLSHEIDDFLEMRRTYVSYPQKRFHFLLCFD